MLLVVVLTMIPTALITLYLAAVLFSRMEVGDLIVDLSNPEKDIFRLEINPDFEEKVTKLSSCVFRIKRFSADDSNEKQLL